MPKRIEIKTSTILKILGVLLGLIFLWFIRDIVVIVFFALIIASAANPLVNRLHKHKIPRPLGVLIVYAGGALIAAFIVVTIVSPLSQELRQLSQVVPQLSQFLKFGTESFQQFPQLSSELQDFLLNLSERLSQISINVFSLTGNVLGALASVVAVFVISFYLAVEDQGIRKFLQDITPEPKEKFVIELWEKSQRKLGAWLKAEFMLALSIGFLTFLGLKLLGIRYALVLGLIAAVFELIPYVGPILASIPAILIALIKGPLFALLTLGLYIIIQQIENYVLAPQVMKKAVALNPIVVIIVLLVGFKIGGFLGIILAVPVTVLAIEITREVFNIRGVKMIEEVKR